MKIKNVVRANYPQIIIVFCVFLTMVLVSYVYVSSMVQVQMVEMGEETMNTTETVVTSYMNESKIVFNNIEQSIESMLSTGRSNEEVEAFLRSVTDIFTRGDTPLPDFMKVYGYIRGEFLDGAGWIPDEDYNPLERPWYIGADQTEDVLFFAEPYVDAQTGNVVISYSKKIKDASGADLGILAMDLNLSRITAYVKGQTLASNGYGVLISDSFHFVVHSNNELIGSDIRTINEDYRELADRLQAGEHISAFRMTAWDGTDSIAFFRTILDGWHVGVITPRADYYQNVYNLGFVLLVLGTILAAALSGMLLRASAQRMQSEEENKSKSSFLARMSHEMRTPMNAIIGMTKIARESDDITEVQYCLDKVSDASNHLLGIINDILDMSKIEAGKLELVEKPFSFQSMLKQIKTVNGFKIEEKQQKFTITVAEDVPAMIIGDKQLLTQVITNLISNAIKFTPEKGEISLSISKLSEADHIVILQFDIIDNGIGISEEQQRRLFKRFEQADVSTSRKYGGTGLGLSISQSIVKLMGGEILVASNIGEGSHFQFTIQVTVPGQMSEHPAAEEMSQEIKVEDIQGIFSGKRILLAEDVDINREIIQLLLKETGLIIDSAENGVVACNKVEANAAGYDLIFMDIHMPELDGYEATKRIRAMDTEKTRTIPIIAMTANVFREDIERCLAAGMNDHIGKPIEFDVLIGKLKDYLLTDERRTDE